MTKPLRALGLVVVVLAAVACGPQLTGALKPRATANSSRHTTQLPTGRLRQTLLYSGPDADPEQRTDHRRFRRCFQ